MVLSALYVSMLPRWLEGPEGRKLISRTHRGLTETWELLVSTFSGKLFMIVFDNDNDISKCGWNLMFL